jgi:hypothetical protein
MILTSSTNIKEWEKTRTPKKKEEHKEKNKKTRNAEPQKMRGRKERETTESFESNNFRE